MKTPRAIGKFFTATKTGLMGIGFAVGIALMIHFGAAAAQQTPAGQPQSAPIPSQAPGSAPTAGQGGGSRFREPDPIAFDDHTGYVQLFDGVSLNGWDGDP